LAVGFNAADILLLCLLVHSMKLISLLALAQKHPVYLQPTLW